MCMLLYNLYILHVKILVEQKNPTLIMLRRLKMFKIFIFFFFTDVRLKFLTALMFIILVASVVITFLRFGGTMLQDNFVAELTTHYQNSVEFVSFYGLLNFYLYTMAFVYSPSKNALYGKTISLELLSNFIYIFIHSCNNIGDN